ncbi:9815_t:CDS:2, partial [Racocetra fulgida]
RRASWISKDGQHKIEQVVDAFIKTKVERLHFTSPSVIGVFDTTNSHDPTFMPEDLQGHVLKQDKSYMSITYNIRGDETNGRIPDFRLRVVIPKKKVEIMVGESCRNGADENKDAEERLEREIVNYKIKDINCEIREQFNDIDLFAIQSIGYTKLALFVFDLVDGIAIRKGRKELYPIFSNTSEYHQILPNYVTPLSPPHNLALFIYNRC